ncbi:MAG: alpha/beta hydrolase [Myxococcales bacterium]|nr:alpha/beta hydrolase [Myxococcales bacterium]
MSTATAAPEKRAYEFALGSGITLRGDAYGDPSARPALLLHGGGQTRHSWAGAAAALGAAGWRAVALDLRGHGESDWAPNGEYGFENFAADTLAVAKSFREPPVLIGASLGGISALITEGESDESVAAAIVLVDVTPSLEPKGVERIIGFMTQKPEGFANLEEAAAAIASYREHRPKPKNLSGLAKNLRQAEDGRWHWHWDPAFIRSGKSVDHGAANQPERLLVAARNLRVPTLLVRGKESDVVSVRGAEEFIAAVPHAKFADVSGAGHMVAGDRNDAFTAAVLAFLAEEFGADPSR